MNDNTVKALQIFDEYLPITENWAHRLLDHTPGVDFTIFAKSYLTNNYFNPEFKYLDHPAGHLWKADQKLDKSRPYEWCLKAALRVFRYFSPGYTSALDRYLQLADYDVVHAHFANIAWDFHSPVKKHKLPYVMSFYGWDYEKLPFVRPKFQQHFQQLFEQCAAVVCEGPFGAQTLVEQGCPEEKIEIIHLGLDCGNIPFFERTKERGTLKLIQIAAFSETKGFLEAIRAFALASQDCPGMEYTIIGVERQAGYKEAIENLIRSLGMEQQILLRPKIDYRQLHQELQHHHIFIHPSQYSAEKDCEGGAPIIILDAQATGLPVLSTTHCDIPNEVTDGQTGWLSPEKDVEALAENIRQCYQLEQKEYQARSIRARQKMEREFAIQDSGQQLAALYHKISGK